MAYSKQNLAATTDIMNGFYNIWVYKSADSFATVKAANYIVDALAEGLKIGDMLIVVDTATPAITLTGVLTVTSSGATVGQTGTALQS